MPKERVGFIFECGRDGPDYQVCKCLLARLNSEVEMEALFLDHKERLLSECGPVAAGLLKTCVRVMILWDLEPPWERRKKCCRRHDAERAYQSLKSAHVRRSDVSLICIERELESWLLADIRAVSSVLRILKRPHSIEGISEYKKPDQIKRPKTILVSLFEQQLGKSRKYVDRFHALEIAKAIPDFKKLRRSDSFCRFAERAARVSV